MHDNIALLANLSVSLVIALIFGYVTERLRLSPIVGYLLAGIVLGPFTPGISADVSIANQFAEIGVVLLMFGVGLHFHLDDLWAVRRVALPGAIGQILVATVLGTAVTMAAGQSLSTGLVVGIAISVASTVVLVRVLTDNQVLDTSPGQIAVGWLIVEDIFTVLVLVALPALAGDGTTAKDQGLWLGLAMAVVKIVALGVLVIAGGQRIIPWLLGLVARSRSSELFTLTVLALALAIATGSTVFFGVSMALGAFLAGMVVGQTEVSHQAAAAALPMRDAFAVLFFVSVGMVFDPQVLITQPVLLVSLLAIVMVAKPLTAVAIVWGLGYSVRSALSVAVGLAQIGEFSFLLASEASHHQLLPKEGQSLLVAAAVFSISLNPLLFRTIGPIEMWLRNRSQLWKIISRRSDAKGAELNLLATERLLGTRQGENARPTALVVGYGPVGQTASRVLNEFGVQPVVIDLNVDTIRSLSHAGKPAIYGDATRRDILEAAGVRDAKFLLITVPDVLVRTVAILTAKDLNSDLHIIARARYLQERAWLEEMGATDVCTEEGEVSIGLAALLLRKMDANEDRIRAEVARIKRELDSREGA